MDKNEFIKAYWQQYKVLEKRIIELSEYVIIVSILKLFS